jgi:hypothetical protein
MDQSRRVQVFLIAEPETIGVCKMTTACVTYNTFLLLPLKSLREYERAFQRQKSRIVGHSASTLFG